MSACRLPLILLLCLSVTSSGLWAGPRPAERTAPSPLAVLDVARTPQGNLGGRYIDGEGRGIPHRTVSLTSHRREIGATVTGADGRYQFSDVTPGVYELSIDGQQQMVRVWDASARPPAARDLVTIVRPDTVIRGQLDDRVIAQIGIGIGVAGAIGAGIAIADARDAKNEADDLRQLLKVSSP